MRTLFYLTFFIYLISKSLSAQTETVIIMKDAVQIEAKCINIVNDTIHTVEKNKIYVGDIGVIIIEGTPFYIYSISGLAIGTLIGAVASTDMSSTRGWGLPSEQELMLFGGCAGGLLLGTIIGLIFDVDKVVDLSSYTLTEKSAILSEELKIPLRYSNGS